MARLFTINSSFKPGNCPHCKASDWSIVSVFDIINPNGEYVEGYGCTPVSIQIGFEYMCKVCHYRIGNPVKKVNLPG